MTEAIWRKDDIINDAMIENHDDEDLKHYGQSIPGLIHQKFHTITFRTWQKKWKCATHSFL